MIKQLLVLSILISLFESCTISNDSNIKAVKPMDTTYVLKSCPFEINITDSNDKPVDSCIAQFQFESYVDVWQYYREGSKAGQIIFNQYESDIPWDLYIYRTNNATGALFCKEVFDDSLHTPRKLNIRLARCN
jgi:hypothetical protein